MLPFGFCNNISWGMFHQTNGKFDHHETEQCELSRHDAPVVVTIIEFLL